ncbi:coiled-coil domain-containing protein 107 [Excalfactoria chinensis]|uniref:coiled-coil domain-containing protein 107 n=1 Tax=Excalfactoria chinensis TaxID=46218 RepID=UPI003B3BC685
MALHRRHRSGTRRAATPLPERSVGWNVTCGAQRRQPRTATPRALHASSPRSRPLSAPRRAGTVRGQTAAGARTAPLGYRSSFPPLLSGRRAGVGPAAAMVLSVSQQAVVSVVLVLCLLVVMPRMFGGGGGGGRAGRAPRGGRAGPGHFEPQQQQQHRGSPQTVHQVHPNPGNPEGSVYQSIQQMRNAMAKEMKSERTRGNGRDLAFTLMPLYALGVGVFAAYKFLKMKAHEENLSEKEKSTEEKAKETEHQLLELEQHLAQTEKMLNSLLTQLDPLSNCVNALACEQKDEIMTQIQSIRRLMKESGLDKSENKMTDVSHVCDEKLEDLLQSFAEHSQEKEMNDREDDGNEDLHEDVDDDCRIEERELCDECEVHQFETDGVEDQEMINKGVIESEMGLRRRNKYE